MRAVVRWADRYDVPLVARSGGHGYNGDSTSASAVVVDLDALNHISYAATARATIGPGARPSTSTPALAAKRRDDPRRLLPDGRPRRARARRRDGPRRAARSASRSTASRASTSSPPTAGAGASQDDDDLFWALRGGGGSFAIVTAVRLKTRHVTNAAFFRITYPRGARDEALHDWDAFAPRAPSALTAILTLDSRRRQRLRPVPGVRAEPAQADRAAAAAPPRPAAPTT